jgi:hypothetical protein
MFSFLSAPEKLENAYPNVTETIPRSVLGYGTNPVYPGFPPIMMDGRAIVSSYQPEAVLNKSLLKDLGIQSNWQYRQYLIQNGKDIMRYNYSESSNDVGYFKRYVDTPNQYSVPFVFPSFISQDVPNGYQTSDLKQAYLTREQLNARKVAPAITQAEILSFNK